MANPNYALVGADDGVVRLAHFVAPPPDLPAAKGLRWLPVEDVAPTPGDGEYLDGPAVAVDADKVRRVWTVRVLPPPWQITMLQARTVLLRRGLLAAVEAAVQTAGGEAALAWEYATVIDRVSPLVAAIAGVCGLDDGAVDELFREAGRI